MIHAVNITKQQMLKNAKEDLTDLYFVRWDRYIDAWDKEKVLIFYGWIDRKKDNYKDFIVLEYWQKYHGRCMFVTSSAVKELEIEKILKVKYDPNDVCKRVEELFPDLNNAIKL